MSITKGNPFSSRSMMSDERILWLVSTRGHFETPQGSPDLSRADSVQALVDVLLTTGFR